MGIKIVLIILNFFLNMSLKIYFIYKCILNRVFEREDEVFVDIGDVVVVKLEFLGMLVFFFVNGVKVVDNGYKMVYFVFIGRNYDIFKVYDEKGYFKGFYVDVLVYIKCYGDMIEMFDLFLDIFVFLSGEVFFFDEDEFEMVLNYRLIDKKIFDFVYLVVNEIFEKFKWGEFL